MSRGWTKRECALYDASGVKDEEWVWARILRQEADDVFVCRLLNEPFQECSLHEGDWIRVAVRLHEEELVCDCIGKVNKSGT